MKRGAEDHDDDDEEEREKRVKGHSAPLVSSPSLANEKETRGRRKNTGGDGEEKSGAEWLAEAKEKKKQGELMGSLMAAARGVELCLDHLCNVWLWDTVMSSVRFSEEEKRQLMESAQGGDRGVMYLVAVCLDEGHMGFSQDVEKALELYSRAVALRHVYASYAQAMLYKNVGDASELVVAQQLMQNAADQGCGDAWGDLGFTYAGKKQWRSACVAYQRAVSLGAEVYTMGFNKLVHQHPFEVAPWGVWEPNASSHTLTVSSTHAEIYTWLLISQRTPLPRHVGLLTAGYICTKPYER